MVVAGISHTGHCLGLTLAEGPSAALAPLRKRLRLGAASGGAPGAGGLEFGNVGGSSSRSGSPEVKCARVS